jgi:hypothetical protein
MKKPALIPVGMKYSQTGGDRNRDSKGKHLMNMNIVNLLNHAKSQRNNIECEETLGESQVNG